MLSKGMAEPALPRRLPVPRGALPGAGRARNLCYLSLRRAAAARPGRRCVAWVSFARGGFRHTGTPDRISLLGTGPRGFCARCGTPLTYRNAARPGEIDVTSAVSMTRATRTGDARVGG